MFLIIEHPSNDQGALARVLKPDMSTKKKYPYLSLKNCFRDVFTENIR